MSEARLYVDMDGTLAEFRTVNELEQLYEKGYFLNLKPQENVVNAVKQIVTEHPEVEVYILSSVLTDSKYALNEKNAWLDRYLPEIAKENRLFVPCGESKRSAIKGGPTEHDFLFDDYTKNLVDWEPPGRGIKLINNINHTNGTWKKDRIRYNRESDDLVNRLLAVSKGIKNVFDTQIKNEKGEKKDMEKAFSVWLGNLSKYSEGKLVGEWIDLPTSVEKLHDIMNNIGVGTDGEYFIADTDVPMEVEWMRNEIDQYDNIYDINLVAAMIKEHEPDSDRMSAALVEGGNLSNIEVANLIAQEDEIPFYNYEFTGMENVAYMRPEEKYGYTITEQNGTYAALEEIGMEGYVDFGAIGSDKSMSGEVTLYDSGYYNMKKNLPDLSRYSKEDLIEMAELETVKQEEELEETVKENAPKM